jgi:hypothetical protein
LEDAVDGLPRGERNVLTLRSVEGLSERECAECLGVDLRETRVRLGSARKLLQEGLGLEDAAAADQTLGALFDLSPERRDEIVESVLESLAQRSSGIRPVSEDESDEFVLEELEATGAISGSATTSADPGSGRERSVIVADDDALAAAGDDEPEPRRSRRSWLPFGKRSA